MADVGAWETQVHVLGYDAASMDSKHSITVNNLKSTPKFENHPGKMRKVYAFISEGFRMLKRNKTD